MIVGGLALGVTLSDGRISLDDKAAKFISQWKGEFWRWRRPDGGKTQDAFTLSRDTAPVLFEPGTDWAPGALFILL